MRVLAVGAVAAASLALAGCYVQSVHPLSTEDKLTFDPGLVGTWTTDAPDDSIVIEVGGENSYKLTDTDAAEYNGYLVRLGESVYLDVFPVHEGKACGNDFVPLHSIIRIHRDGDEMKAAGVDFEWMGKRIDSKETPISHFRYDGRIILSMETEQLQQAIMEFAATEDAFEEPAVFHRAK